jgi:hypothetical protein
MALGDILWLYTVAKTTQEGRFIKTNLKFYESGTHTGKMRKSAEDSHL